MIYIDIDNIYIFILAYNNILYMIYIDIDNIYINIGMCVCFLPIHSGHQVRWTYQPGSHRRKVTQEF